MTLKILENEVYVRYYVGSPFSMGTNSIINFDTMDYDPQGLVTTGASWKFTPKNRGLYLINSSIESSSQVSISAGQYLYMTSLVNGGSPKQLGIVRADASVTRYFSLTGVGTVFLEKDDYLSIQGTCSISITLGPSSVYQFVEIAKLN